ncbi:YslB family protein [Loigolactobacillus zhaoyuanensis]|uniref:YslB family protein n=1 Tax=Loigolactobacillus zhaoyuanensis TaxID=2486017 RepID=UPI000F7438C8|nr:YslB family protein [Loigolactobacillus zhaoyuanensis]
MPENHYESLLRAVSTPETLGYELLRDILLPDLLGQEAPGILYWAGKDLARRLPLSQLEDLPTFFAQFNFGELTLSQQTKNRYIYQLDGQQIERRQKAFSQADFQLETGFIAQQIQQLTNTIAEGQLEFDRNKITIIIQTDHTDVPPATTIDQPIQLHHFGSTDKSAAKTPTDPSASDTPVSDLMPKRTQRHKRGWFSRN